jgi:hypothetical protein
MKLFRNKNKQQNDNGAASSKAAEWLAFHIAKVQGYWAKGMDKLFNHLSARSQKITLIGACLVMVLYSTAVIAFSFSKARTLMTKPSSAIQPLSIIKSGNPMPVGVPAYIGRIERFKDYLDSLSHTLDGRRIRDSILERRPGLLDSIQRIEIIYCKR